MGTLIKKIDIKNFGSFNDLNHNKSVNEEFEHLNIFYGKNYSGKSTFSRIFQTLEREELPKHYGNVSFSLQLEDKNVTEKDILESDKPIIKVFNADYVRENLNFFKEAGINSFTLAIGESNSKIEPILNGKRVELKEVEEKIEKQSTTLKETEQRYKDVLKKKENFFKKSARKIKNKNNPSISKTSYNKIDFQEEISCGSKSPKLSQDHIKEFKDTLLEEEKTLPLKLEFKTINFSELKNRANKLLSKKVSMKQSIAEMENNDEVEQWIKDGFKLHKHGEEKDCIFCGNPIDSARFNILEDIFSKEVEEFEVKIEKFIEELETKEKEIEKVKAINVNSYYSKYKNSLRELNQRIENERLIELAFIKKLKEQIINKKKSLFKLSEDNKEDVPEGFQKLKEDYDNIYENNKKFNQDLLSNKNKAKDSLRYDFINKLLTEENYQSLEKQYKICKEKFEIEKNRKKDLEVEQKNVKSDIEKLVPQLSNEKNAAKRINYYLNHALGHEELRLDILERPKKEEAKDVQSSFHVMRNNQIAFNLSEGEMSLVAFAYYLASLERISELERKNTILFVDDPISSLDENNIFYIYSLIYDKIIKKDYQQIFITTHNLDFLKYATRYRVSKQKKKKYFMISKVKTSSSKWKSEISPLPKFMYVRVTEFNFLFEQIYKVAVEEQTDENYHVFYNFPNNARKFLETLLFFKYPNYKYDRNSTELFEKFFGEEIHEPYINRLHNEFSHGEGRFDRLMKNVNTAEFKADAQLILKRIHHHDEQQFHEFLENSSLAYPDFL